MNPNSPSGSVASKVQKQHLASPWPSLAHKSANSSSKISPDLCWSCRSRPALREGAPSPPGSRLPRTRYPKSSRRVRFLARTWEQEGALRDVRVPAHVLQRDTRAAQTREPNFPTPKIPLERCFPLQLAMNSISLPRVGVRGERICHALPLSQDHSSFFSSKRKKGREPGIAR